MRFVESSILRGGLLEYRAQNRWLVIIIILFMGGLMGRFFQLQVLGGKKYEKLAEINQVKRMRIPARRGVILDRKGRVVAKNVDLYRVTIVPHYVQALEADLDWLRQTLFLTDPEVEAVRARVVEYSGDKRKRFRDVLVKRFVNGKFCPNDGTLLDEVSPAKILWCRQCGGELVEIPRGQSVCPFDQAELSVRTDGLAAECPVCKRKFTYARTCPDDATPLTEREHDLHCPRCLRHHSDSVAIIRNKLHEHPGVFLSEQIIRAYPFGELFAHAVGFINEVSSDEIERHPDVYVPGDVAGRRGVERSMEEVLRGRAGEEVSFRDGKGRQLDFTRGEQPLANLKYEPAIPGNNVVLTLDLEIQKVLRDALAKEQSAGVVVMEADTGEVLGIYSTPPYDPNDWAGRLTAARKKEYDDNFFNPLINKAATAFPPASSFKIVTALAALSEGLVTPDTKVNCPGFFDYSGHRFGCYNKYGHGDLDLHRALIVSCDVYFYRLGEWLGMDRLEQYASMLGLGKKTGIEIGEDRGLVPSREWHERHSKGGFQPGFTISTAVGQKDIRATPIQMAMVMAEVVNGGHVIHPFLVDRVEDMHGNMVRSLRRQSSETLDLPKEYLQFLKLAMAEAVDREDGTGFKARLESIKVGGKTGTAEAKQVMKGVEPYIARWLAEDHSWFVGFAPVNHPRIVIAVIVEHGGYGGNVAAPLASKIIYKLFSNNLIPER
jgi:penicillin-binding protein 2